MRETKAAFPLRTASIRSLRGAGGRVLSDATEALGWGERRKKATGALKWTWGSGVISGIHVL